MTNFEQMENDLREAGRVLEAARINGRSLTADERTLVFEARVIGIQFAMSEAMMTSYMEEGAEQARMVLR